MIEIDAPLLEVDVEELAEVADEAEEERSNEGAEEVVEAVSDDEAGVDALLLPVRAL